MERKIHFFRGKRKRATAFCVFCWFFDEKREKNWESADDTDGWKIQNLDAREIVAPHNFLVRATADIRQSMTIRSKN